MNAFVEFFTKTIPSFAETNWVIIMSILFGLAVILGVALIVVLVLKKKQHTRFNEQLTEWVGKNTERVKQLEKKEEDYKELNQKYADALAEAKTLKEVSEERIETVRHEFTEKNDALENELSVCKEVLAERERDLGAMTKECQEKDTKIANMTIERDKLAERVVSAENELVELKNTKYELTAEIEDLESDLREARKTIESLEVQLKETTEGKAKVEVALVEMSAKEKDLRVKYTEALKEIDYLKNFELENEILLKTIRKLRTDEQADAADTKVAIVDLEKRLNSRIEEILESMTAKIISSNVEKLDLSAVDTLKRSQLSKIAKEVGITNYATWSNEKLRAEIKKYKK